MDSQEGSRTKAALRSPQKNAHGLRPQGQLPCSEDGVERATIGGPRHEVMRGHDRTSRQLLEDQAQAK